MVWHFQHLPSDNWNPDHVFERVLVDGKQYLAIPVGTNMLAQFSRPLTPENVVPADRAPGNGSLLMVFVLPDPS